MDSRIEELESRVRWLTGGLVACLFLVFVFGFAVRQGIVQLFERSDGLRIRLDSHEAMYQHELKTPPPTGPPRIGP